MCIQTIMACIDVLLLTGTAEPTSYNSGWQLCPEKGKVYPEFYAEMDPLNSLKSDSDSHH